MTFFASLTIRVLLISVGALALQAFSSAASADDEVESDQEIGIGGGLLFPLIRPQIVLEGAFPIGSAQLGLKAGFSYISLRESFQEAAEASEYANKLVTSSASMSELTLTIPELTFWLGQSVFLTAGGSVRSSVITAAYKTLTDEPLVFKSWGVAAGMGISAGYRFYVSPKLAFGFSSSLHSPFKTTGWASVDYTRDNTIAVPTLNDTELDQMLEALEPYLQTLAKQTTVAATLRLVYLF